jgi:hypothetical protein
MRAGITIPVPRAADVTALLVNPNRKSESAQPVQHVHPRKTGADHDDIVGRGGRGVAFAGTGLQGGHLFALHQDCSGVGKQHSIPAVKAQETNRALDILRRGTLV